MRTAHGIPILKVERWDKVQDLFAAAADLPRDQRDAFLDEQCGPDRELRDEVESLLGAECGASTFVANAIGSAAVKMAAAQPDSRERIVGAYRILGEIGHGGMGTVYLAERADHQFRKKVAIKMARFAGHDRFLLERFRYERQILAALEHTNIARLLDGGETEDGIPYLVMEYVEGSAITDFVKAANLDLRGRLDLFLKVAAAVQYAHQSSIIHRDLKPANVLVTKAGEPKLLDFGIAKLLEPGLFEEARVETSTGLRLLTPDYASPEQVRGLPVTTSTDVYSLGAILYELLTGARPHAIQEYTPLGIDHAVCEAPTERPSKAAERTGSLGGHSPELSADLDVIVLKAMHKEPARRYISVEHLAEDIRRYLEGRPIQARGDSKSYRTAKFLKRHRIAAGAAALLLITLMGGIAATSWQAVRARDQARRAEMRFRQVRQLAQRFLFDFDEQIRNLAGSTEARRTVVKTAQEYLDSLALDASNDVELRRELALAYKRLGDIQGGPRYANLGRSEDALKSYQTAAGIGRRLMEEGRQDPALLEHMIETTRVLGLLENRVRKQGQKETYAQRLDESIALAEALHRERPDLTSVRLLAAAYRERGENLADTDDPIAADRYYAKALPLYEEARRMDPGARSDRGVLVVIHRFGDVKVMLGDLEGGRQMYQTAVERAGRLVNASGSGQGERRTLLSCRLSLGAVLGDPHIPNLGRTGEAIRETRTALEICERLAEADPANRTAKLDLAYAEAQLGRILRQTRPDEAVRRLRRAVALAEEVSQVSGADRVYTRHLLQYRKDLGMALGAAGRSGEAKTQFEQVRATVAALPEPANSHRLIGAEAQREISVLLRRSDRAKAAEHALEALNAVEAYYRGHLQSIEIVDDLSQFYEAAAAFDTSWLEKARELWIQWAKTGHSSEFDRRRLREIAARN